MNIHLVGSKVDGLSLLKNDEKIEKMEFSFSTAFSDENPKRFLIIFNLKLKIGSEYLLTVCHLSQFETDEDMGENERRSPFLSVNAPAIAYPFLRAFVSNLLLNSGFDPVILPTINFVELSKEKN